MFVCICNQVTDKQIRGAVESGVCSLEALSTELKVGSCCGKCKHATKKIMRDVLQQQSAYDCAVPVGFISDLSPA